MAKSVITVSDLYINGTAMPEPLADGVLITRTKLFSQNKGYTSAGKLVGTVLAVRTTIKIQWGGLSPDDAALIEAATTTTDAVPVKYTDPTGNTITENFIFDGPSYTWGHWLDGSPYLSAVTVSGESECGR